VAEVLRTLIGVYKEAFKVPTLSDAVMFDNYAQTIIVLDEVCKEVSGDWHVLQLDAPCASWRERRGELLEGYSLCCLSSLQGLVEHMDRQSIFKAVAFKAGRAAFGRPSCMPPPLQPHVCH
jgi:hypothetical protein